MMNYNWKIFYNIVAFLVVAIWGVTFISTKVLINSGLLPSHIYTIRFVIAYLGIWALCAQSKETRKLTSNSLKDEFIFIITGITGGSIYFLFENSALAYTQACNVSFIVCSAPLITALLTLLVKTLFKGELVDGLEEVRLRWTLVIGTVLAFGGMAAVIFDGSGIEFSPKGDLMALGAAMCWGIYSIFMSQMTKRYGTLFATRKVFFYGLITVIPFLIGTSFDPNTLSRPEVWGNLLFLALIASLGCFVLWNKSMAKLGNVSSTNYVYLNPLFTLVAAVVLLGESLSFQSALGCLAIISGVIIGGMKK